MSAASPVPEVALQIVLSAVQSVGSAAPLFNFGLLKYSCYSVMNKSGQTANLAM